MPGISTRLDPTSTEQLCVVVVTGEVDPATVVPVSLFLAANCPPRHSIELDLSEITFTDCSLLRLLETERQDRAGHHATVRVVRPSEPVRRLLELTDQADLLRGPEIASVG